MNGSKDTVTLVGTLTILLQKFAKFETIINLKRKAETRRKTMVNTDK